MLRKLTKATFAQQAQIFRFVAVILLLSISAFYFTLNSLLVDSQSLIISPQQLTELLAVTLVGSFLSTLLLAQLLIYSAFPPPHFLFYVGYCLILACTLFTASSLVWQTIFSSIAWLQAYAFNTFAAISLCLSILLFKRLLVVGKQTKSISLMLNACARISLVALPLQFVLPMPVFHLSFLCFSAVVTLILLGTALNLTTQQKLHARVYVVACSGVLLVWLGYSLQYLSLVSFALTALQWLGLAVFINSLCLMVIFSRNHQLNWHSLQNAQQTLITQQQQQQDAQQQLLALQEQTTEQLEYKVQERTLELEIALRELSEINRELAQKNTLDSLTGIRNRSYFDQKYIAEIRRSRREHTFLSVVMVDIDHFKKVNDHYGHLVGDECIKSVAGIIQKALKRPSDVACRYGGEEFALILPNTELSGALTLVEQLRQDIQNTSIQSQELSIQMTISAGICCAMASLKQAEDAILAEADKQLYLAKKAGRNKVSGCQIEQDKI